MTYFDDELRRRLSRYFSCGLLTELGPDSAFLGRLESSFPFSHSRIDWSKLPYFIERYEYDPTKHVVFFSSHFRKMVEAEGLVGEVIYFGDNATEISIIGDVSAYEEAIEVLMELPQHHFLVDRDFTWCMSMTMEGDAAFGRTARPGG